MQGAICTRRLEEQYEYQSAIATDMASHSRAVEAKDWALADETKLRLAALGVEAYRKRGNVPAFRMKFAPKPFTPTPDELAFESSTDFDESDHNAWQKAHDEGWGSAYESGERRDG